MIKDILQIAVTNLKQRSLRSWITTLGVVISVASIIILLLVSQGLRTAIEEQFEKIGSNKIFLSSAAGQPGLRAGLTEKDIDSAERTGDFEYIVPYLMEPAAEVEFGQETLYLLVTGYPTEDAKQQFESFDITMQEGRAFVKGEAGGAVIGSMVADEIFDRDVGLRNKLVINGKKYTVVGIMDSIGNSQDDSQIMIPLDDARELFEKPDEVSFIDLTVKEGVEVTEAADRLERQLDRDRTDDNFRIMTPTQILGFLNATLGIVQAILVSIAGISLVVGAVGIMNMMFTSVLERTKEIGVMKSIGARNKDVLMLFIIEAGLIGFIGGLCGVLIGGAVSLGIGFAAEAAGFALLKIQLDPLILFFGLLFATLTGMVSGYLPARRAAVLHPVDALRW